MKELLLKKGAITLLILILPFLALAQSSIKGKVLSEDDQAAVPGATIKIKGTSTAVFSDANGEFSITAAANDILVVSSIGYSNKEVKLGARKSIVISLSVAQTNIADLVVVGYGTEKKKDLTGAVSLIKPKDIQYTPLATVDQALQGKVPGLQVVGANGQPGSFQDIIIRGNGSITGNTAPLYVIDGVPFSNSDVLLGNGFGTTSNNPLVGLNPNDIENISILKDASSTSIYGSRGANGVILITTRQGKSGKTRITLNAQIGKNDYAFLPNVGKALSASQLIPLTREGLLNAGYTAGGADSNLNSNLYANLNVNTDWLKVATQNSVQQQYDIAASGGDEKTQFYVSGSFFDQNGLIIGTSLKKESGDLSITHKYSDKLKLSAKINISNSDITAGLNNNAFFASPYAAAKFLLPTISPYNSDGSLNINNFPGGGFYNPIYNTRYNFYNINNIGTFSNLVLEYNILKDLKYTYSGSINYYLLKENIYENPNEGDGSSVNGRGINNQFENFNWDMSNQLDYKLALLPKDDLVANFKVGYEAQETKFNALNVESDNYPQTSLTSSAIATTPKVAAYTPSSFTFASLYSNISLNYKSKYILSGSFRNDGSSKFSTAHRYGNFYSIGGSWNLEKEAFFEKLTSVLSDAKLRASFGTSGNDLGPYYASYQLLSFGANYAGSPGIVYNSPGNPTLTWEKAQQFDIGTDLSFFKSRLNVTFDFYRKITQGLLLNQPVSLTTGFTSFTNNIGGVKNIGEEIFIEGIPVTGKFTWRTSLSVALNKNAALSLPIPSFLDNNGFRIREGVNIKSFETKEWAGVNPANGAPLWYIDGTKKDTTSNYNKALTVTTNKVATPSTFGSFTNEFSMAGFKLSAQLYYNFGNFLLDNFSPYYNDGQFEVFNKTQKALQRWTTPGQKTDVPKYIVGNANSTNSNQASTRFLYSGDYVRLRNITLTYTLPRSLLNSLKVNNISVFARGTNLWTYAFDKNLPFDPEQGKNGAFNDTSPQLKTYVFGINVSL
jgi:TonB-linked SusC/RagA family outer membrane protein